MALDLIFVVTLTIRKAKLLPYCAGVAELADAQDLKSWGPTARTGSIPVSGISFHLGHLI